MDKNYKRVLKIELPQKQSAFLWGARKTGKSTFLKENFKESVYIDFLRTDLMTEYTIRPSTLRERLVINEQAHKFPVILDEVQKVPSILDEVHWLIENTNMNFILCGSSARKLIKNQSNLLGGRAWRYEMFPLVYPEIDNYNLLQALTRGLIPNHYNQIQYQKSLKAYCNDYLKEEVFNEGLTRNIPAFSRFFESLGYSHGEMTNYANIARECGIDAKTVKEYYQILIDTLLGYFVLPYKKNQNRQVITKTPKFYLFDVGIAGYLTKRYLTELKGEQFGRAFEHLVFLEINAYRSLNDLDFPINYWRTKTGIEVDFILGDAETAIEVKGKNRIDNKDLRGLKTFAEENKSKQLIIVCNENEPRKVDNILILPWKTFFEKLWANKII